MSRARAKKRGVSRRAFLHGAGKVAIALPVAEFVMDDGKLIAAEAGEPITRLITYSFPNGMHTAQWNYGAALQPLQPLAGKIALVQNLLNMASVPGDHHEQGAGTMFVGFKMPPQPGQKAQNSGGLSMDQFLAQKLQPTTPVKSLVSGIWRAQGEFLYPKAWYRRSWNADGTAVEPLVNPRDIFNALFNGTLDTPAAKQERASRRSVLDAVVSMYKHTTSERYGLSADAKSRLTQHLEILRETEQSLDAQEKMLGLVCDVPDVNTVLQSASAGDVIPYEQWYDVFSAQWRLFILGMKCDLFRFGSLMFGSAAQKYMISSVNNLDEHAAAHAPDGGAAVLGYRVLHMRKLAEFLAALDAVQEGGRTMLDNTIVVVGSEHETTNGGHQTDPIPHLVAGGTGKISGLGSTIDAGRNKTTTDLYVDCIRAAGAEPEGFFDQALRVGTVLGG